VEECLYYDRAKRRQLEDLANSLGVSMDEQTKKELA
jgi:predicted DNA binding protein